MHSSLEMEKPSAKPSGQDADPNTAVSSPSSTASEEEGGGDCSKKASADDDATTTKATTPWYRRKLLTVCSWILATEAMERLTFYTIQGSQRNFLQTFGYGNSQSSSLNSAFNVMCYLWALFGGWLADAKLSKFAVILVGGCVYALGTIFTAVAADPRVRSLALYFAGTFGLIAAGTGAIKPCVSNFGGDQVSDDRTYYNPTQT